MSETFEKLVLQKLDTIDNSINEVKTDVAELKEEVIVLKADVEHLKIGVTELNKKVIELTNRLDNVEADMKKMKRSIILIENKVNTDLPALFEVYSLNYDLQKQNVQRTNYLETESNNHSYRIDNLETTTKEHSKKLKKLIS